MRAREELYIVEVADISNIPQDENEATAIKALPESAWYLAARGGEPLDLMTRDEVHEHLGWIEEKCGFGWDQTAIHIRAWHPSRKSVYGQPEYIFPSVREDAGAVVSPDHAPDALASGAIPTTDSPATLSGSRHVSD